jgi:predicted nucleic acid-binding protein
VILLDTSGLLAAIDADQPHHVARGVYRLESLAPGDVGSARAIIERYAALELGLADASVVVLAHRHGCHDILTLDERHFRAIVDLDGEPLRLLPVDASQATWYCREPSV